MNKIFSDAVFREYLMRKEKQNSLLRKRYTCFTILDKEVLLIQIFLEKGVITLIKMYI